MRNMDFIQSMSTRTSPLINPRWLVWCAWGAFLSTVPSAIWRLLIITGFTPGIAELRIYELGDQRLLAYVYVFGLSLVQLGASYLTVGLIKPWGVRFLGRRVPLWPVVVLATIGGLTVFWLFNISMLKAILTGMGPDGFAGKLAGLTSRSALVLMAACYAPILLWAPLELASTYGYWQRRSRPDQA